MVASGFVLLPPGFALAGPAWRLSPREHLCSPDLLTKIRQLGLGKYVYLPVEYCSSHCPGPKSHTTGVFSHASRSDYAGGSFMPERFGLRAECRGACQQEHPGKRGIEKIKAIKSIRLTGKLNGGGGFTAATLQENERPNLVRETFSLQGMTAVTAYDGTTGWQIQPFGGHKDPEFMGEDDLKDLLLDADFDGPLVDFKEKGNTVEFLGHDVVDGDDALRLKVTLKDGDIVYYYLDPDTFLEIRKEVQ